MLSVAQISAKGPLTDVVEVKSCVVSPLSDPKKSPFWTVISDGCSSDPSLTLSAKTKDVEEGEAEGDGELEGEKEEMDRDGDVSLQHKAEKRREASVWMGRSRSSMGTEQEIQPLRFSFILQPVHNDSMQFLHCSLHMCVSDSTHGEPMEETAKTDCQGRLRIPPLISKSPRHQVQKQTAHHAYVS